MSEDAPEAELAQLAYEAKVLTEAAKVFDRLAEGTETLAVDGKIDDDETTEEMKDALEVSADTSAKVATSITMVLADYGYVPDFDEELFGDGDEDDSDNGRAFQ